MSNRDQFTEMTSYYYTSIAVSSPSDWNLYARINSLLPPYPPTHVGGLQGHSVHALRMIIQLLHPVHLLEIGFCLGRSAAMWLELGVLRVTSVDIDPSPLLREAADAISTCFPSRFDLIQCDAVDRDALICRNAPAYTHIFIDGAHDYASITADIALARRLGLRHLLLDDIMPHWGPDTMRAVGDSRLKIHALFGNIAYCEDVADKPEWWEWVGKV